MHKVNFISDKLTSLPLLPLISSIFNISNPMCSGLIDSQPALYLIGLSEFSSPVYPLGSKEPATFQIKLTPLFDEFLNFDKLKVTSKIIKVIV